MFKITINERGTLHGRPPFVFYSEDGKTDWYTNDFTAAWDKNREISAKPGLMLGDVVQICTPDANTLNDIRGADGDPGEVPIEWMQRLEAVERRLDEITAKQKNTVIRNIPY